MGEYAGRIKKGTPERRLKAAQLLTYRSQKKLLKSIETIREEKPELLERVICEGILGKGFQGTDFVLFKESGENNESDSGARRRFRYLATLILDRLDGKRRKPDAPFVSLASWIEEDADVLINGFASNPYSVNYRSLAGTYYPFDAYVSHVRWRYFDTAAEALNWSSMKAARMVYRGIPIFTKHVGSGDFETVPHNNEMCVYLRQKGKLEDVSTGHELPIWANRYFVKSEHLRMHDALFFSDYDLSAEQLEIRRSILMAQCGTANRQESISWPWGSHETDLLRTMASAAREWWSTYDADVPATAPTNEEVSAWLKSKGVAKRVAEVMAQILRADGLSTGPRK